MVVVETSVFTRRVGKLLDDDEYRLLQLALVRNPRAGVLIQGSGVYASFAGLSLGEAIAEEYASSITGPSHGTAC